jgi:hypothetical protein
MAECGIDLSQFIGNYTPITISGDYDNDSGAGWIGGTYYAGAANLSSNYKGDEMEIGGNTCHLCGAVIILRNTYGHLGKQDQWRTETYVRYRCGTTIETSAKGKKKVARGDKCIII